VAVTAPARRAVATVAVGLLVLSGVAASCGDDESSSTSTTIESKGAGSSGSGSSSDSSSSGSSSSDSSTSDSEFAEEIQARGEPTMSKVDGPVTELQIIDDVVGTGKAATADSTVSVQYSGVLAADGSEFDSSWSRGQPVEFPLSGVIQGWSEGLIGMKEGGRRTLIIPAEMAYGSQGRPGIPADSALVFTVDLEQVS